MNHQCESSQQAKPFCEQDHQSEEDRWATRQESNLARQNYDYRNSN
jgi:hypothetical protein